MVLTAKRALSSAEIRLVEVWAAGASLRVRQMVREGLSHASSQHEKRMARMPEAAIV